MVIIKKVLVIGSLNVDFSINCNNMPKIGETVDARELIINNGGKGANQAYTIGNLDGNCSMLGMVGNDIYGENIKNALKEVSVNVDNISKDNNAETGKAFVMVDNNGDNSILIIHGSNYSVTSDFILKNKNIIDESDIILMQLEIPLESVSKVLSLAKDKMIILDPAPAKKEIMNFDLSGVYLMKPNETELETLTGIKIVNEKSIVEGANILLSKGVKNVIVSLGDKGSMLINSEAIKKFSATDDKAIDTTAAGDSFIASITYCLSKDLSLEESINFASKVAGITASRKGAQNSIPSLDEVLNV